MRVIWVYLEVVGIYPLVGICSRDGDCIVIGLC